jgi:hypothetical protein
MGFVRIYIEKLQHLRCLAFVKVDQKFIDVCKSEAKLLSQKLGIEFDQIGDSSKLMFIPQDLTTKKLIKKESTKKDENHTLAEDTKSCHEFLSEFGDIDI